ncbi:MAG: hypothetical protein HY280_08130 [Nitrospinae bacterium]|nr:hypothetical protein [Nitrospinota bacterium]
MKKMSILVVTILASFALTSAPLAHKAFADNKDSGKSHRSQKEIDKENKDDKDREDVENKNKADRDSSVKSHGNKRIHNNEGNEPTSAGVATADDEGKSKDLHGHKDDDHKNKETHDTGRDVSRKDGKSDDRNLTPAPTRRQ